MDGVLTDGTCRRFTSALTSGSDLGSDQFSFSIVLGYFFLIPVVASPPFMFYITIFDIFVEKSLYSMYDLV